MLFYLQVLKALAKKETSESGKENHNYCVNWCYYHGTSGY